MRYIAVVFVALCSVAVLASQGGPKPEFDVASLKKSTTGGSSSLQTSPSGEVIASNMRIQFVVGQAFDYDEMVGMPPWGTDL